MLARRLARTRSGLWWVGPIAAVAVIVALVYVVLIRVDLSEADRKQFVFGGMNTAVSLNDYLSTNGATFELDRVANEVTKVSGGSACAEISTSIQTEARTSSVYGYREFQTPCLASQWGYQLTSGRWADKPGDVVVTVASGLSVGSSIRGLTPLPLNVVGIVENNNATRGSVILAASGTWRSWDWPAATSAFPRLSGVVMIYTTAGNSDALRTFYQNRVSSEAAAATVDINSLSSGGSRTLDRFPFLYLWVALPLAAVAAGLGGALRSRYANERRSLLVAQGMSPRSALRALSWSALLIAIPTAVAGTLVGWTLGVVATPLIQWISGQTPSPAPSPVDPLTRILVGVFLVWLAAFLVSQLPSSRRAHTPRTDTRSSTPRFATLRCVLAVAALGIGIFVAFAIRDASTIFAIVLLAVVAFGLISPDLMFWIAKRNKSAKPATQLAWRRVAARPVAAALTATAAAVAIGPVIAMSVLFASSITVQNDNERLPPREGQALYYPSDDPSVNQAVSDVVTQVAGSDASIVSVPLPQTAEGDGVVATSAGFGLIELVASVGDLNLLLGTPVSDEAKKVLNDGGILWTRDNSASEIWTVGAQPPRSIPLSGSISEQVEERWARAAAGFILIQTAEQHGLVATPDVVAFNGISAKESTQLGRALLSQNLDINIVRTYRADDPFSVSTFQWGLIGILGLLGVVTIVAATRGTVDSLRTQNPGLIALGVPRGWMGKVYLRETGVAVLIGAAVGGAAALAATGSGLLQLGSGVTVPVGPIAIYLAGLAAALVGVGTVGLAKIRS